MPDETEFDHMDIVTDDIAVKLRYKGGDTDVAQSLRSADDLYLIQTQALDYLHEIIAKRVPLFSYRPRLSVTYGYQLRDGWAKLGGDMVCIFDEERIRRVVDAIDPNTPNRKIVELAVEAERTR